MARGAHSQRRRRSWLLIGAATVAVALVVATVVVVGARVLSPGAPTASGATPHAAAAASTTTTWPSGPLTVLSTSPMANAAGVDPGSTISVSLSQPLAASSPMPTFTPPVAGSWSELTPTTLTFNASGPLAPGTQETLNIPGGPGGLVDRAGALLDASQTVPFSVAAGSVERIQQLLAELGYLPLGFTPAEPVTAPQQNADPQAGTFAWKWANQPASLMSLWTEGSANTITTGAIMSFQDQHGLETDGVPGAKFWTALLTASASNAANTAPYGYVVVSQTLPESATVYQNGVSAYTTSVNTGVSGAPTADGTFPVYLRYTTTTMSGTNPDGSTYSDPGIPWVSYFNGGDALHGFVRASYGTPQSDGCVEMPIANAAIVYPMTPIGTLVTVLN
jgi:peptidoglycan hydrolase-like protein with peptidoglycan-binding domain